MSFERPYEGLKVVDLSQGVAGPYCAMLLARHGADVIKVEAIEGDSMRFALAQPKILNEETGKNFLPGEIIDPEFSFANRGKKSICVNVGDAEGIAIVHRLARQCDVFLTNLLPGRLRQFELTYADIKQLNPRAVCKMLMLSRLAALSGSLTWRSCRGFCRREHDPLRPVRAAV